MSDQQIYPPDLDDVLSGLKNEIFADLNCVQIGRIQKVNSNQTVEILLQMKRRIPDNKIADYPLLVDCPYFVLQGGGAYIDMPIKKGDICLVLFNDRNIDTWWSTENVAESPDRRKHNLSDGFALIGVNSDVNPLDNDGTFVRILGTSGPGAEEKAARENDLTEINAVTDSAWYAWLAAVGTATGVGAPPSTITGKISGGSSEVKIG